MRDEEYKLDLYFIRTLFVYPCSLKIGILMGLLRVFFSASSVFFLRFYFFAICEHRLGFRR